MKKAQLLGEKQKEDNYVIEEHEDFCIVKRKKGNNHMLKVLFFASSILDELEHIRKENSEDAEDQFKKYSAWLSKQTEE